MNRRALLLALSLAGNVALGYTLWHRPAAASPTASVTDPTSAPGPSTPHGPAVPTTSATATVTPLWSTLTDLDPTALRDRLTTAGFPPLWVKALVRARIEADFQPLLDDQGGQNLSADYWTPPTRWNRSTHEAYRKITLERQHTLDAVLGPDTDYLPGRLTDLRARYGALSADKLAAIEGLLADYSDLQRDAMPNGQTDRDEAAEVRTLLNEEMDKDLAALLTPAELAEYQLRTSPNSNLLRGQLVGMNVTREEFQLLKQTLDGSPGFQTANASPGRDASLFLRLRNDQARAELATALTSMDPARATQLTAALDPATSEDGRFIARFGLDPTVRATLTQIREAATALSANRNLPAEEREQAVTMVNQRLDSLLTPELAATYREASGRWLKALDRPARPAPSP